MPEELPAYISKKWIENLNQPGHPDLYPLADNAKHVEQLPARFESGTMEECPVGLEATKLISPQQVEQSRVCILTDSTLYTGRAYHCLLYDVICIPLPKATLEQMFMVFKEVYQVRERTHPDVKKKRLPQHLVISKVIDHLAQKNLLKGVLQLSLIHI